jgi:hypothetical protein
MESQGAVLGSLESQWVDPITGVVTDVAYSGNKAIEVKSKRTFDSSGHAKDAETSRRTVADAGSGDVKLSSNSTAGTKISVHPPKPYFDELTAVDQAARAESTQRAAASTRGTNVLAQLGLIGKADAASIITGNTAPSVYYNTQNYGDLTFTHAVWWYNAPGQTGLHSAYLQSIGSWHGAGMGSPDPGGRDAIDVEYDPAVMYLVAATWAPNVQGNTAPNICSGQQFPYNMTSDMGKAWSGAYSQQPSHCNQYNVLQVNIRPKSSASWGVWFNVYFNYTHTWDFNPFGGAISISAGFGFLSVGPGSLGGEWNMNQYTSLLC